MTSEHARFKKIRDLVDWAIAFHVELAKRYKQLAKQSGDKRVAMALDYLSDHEHSMEAALRRHLTSGDDALLDTWFDDVNPLPHVQVLTGTSDSMACENLEDVVGTAITVHKNLGELYRHRAEAAGTEDARRAAYEQVRQMVEWLNVPLDRPEVYDDLSPG